MKPVIGIMPLWDDDKDSIWMLPGYMDGLTEALYKPDSRFLWAVQWHPEYLYRTDEYSRKIFSAFVGTAGTGPVV